MKINVIDAPMGTGKTSAAINFMNENKDIYKFIYITPYLEEVDRIRKQCHFKEPIKFNQNMPKRISLIEYLNNGDNIVTTHSMFHLFDDEIIDLCKAQDYILIMDEVTEVVEQYGMKKKDLELLLNNFVTADEDGILHWTCNEQTEKFEDEKRLCELGCLSIYADTALIWLFPVKVFKAFNSIYLLTYLFNAQVQKYYYDYYNMEYNYLYIAGDSLTSYQFTDKYQEYRNRYNYNELINIIEDEKINMIGGDEGALSKSWYIRNKNNVLIKKMKNNLINFFNNKDVLYSDGKYIKSSSNNNIWTTFSEFKDILSGKGYSKGFIPCNMRASNAYRERSVVAYPINRYFNPLIKNFFIVKGVEVDEDAFAVSEMLQFIWRSAIRDGKHITVYIPSIRMRTLLINWIESQEE